MKIPAEEFVLEVTKTLRVRCPCCGLDGKLVACTPRVQGLGLTSPMLSLDALRRSLGDVEIRVDLIIDTARSRHLSKKDGLGSFSVRVVEELSRPGPPSFVLEPPEPWPNPPKPPDVEIRPLQEEPRQ